MEKGAGMLRLAFWIDEWNRTKRGRGEPILTQQRLADAVGVSRITVVNHANGHTRPTSDTLLAYARVLGVTVEELMSDEAA
jgi:DNA-binding XRE family transcriptional regulator